MKEKIINFVKKVTFTELFYDLVFVLAISKFANVFHEPEDHDLSFIDFSKFIVVIVILLNLWMTKTIFVNKFGKDKLIEKLFTLVDMGLVMYLAFSINSDWSATFFRFNVIFSMLNFNMALQYFYVYFLDKDATEWKKSILINAITFAVLGSSILGAAFIGYEIGLYFILSLAAIFIVLPTVYRYTIKQKNVNLPHLIERLNLLVIIFFGELLITLGKFFKDFDWKGMSGIFYTGSLFLYYILHFEKMADHHKETKKWNILIFTHYFIFIALSLKTLSLEFILENEISYLMNWIIQYITLVIIIAMLFINIIVIGKIKYKYGIWFFLLEIAIASLGFGLGFLNINSINQNFLIASIQITALLSSLLIYLKIKDKKAE